MSENSQIAKDLIEAIGGDENIISAAHCATRLRIMVKDKDKIDQERVENIDKVKGAFFNSGQYQVIFGTGTVNRMYEEVVKLGISGSTKSEQAQEAVKAGSGFSTCYSYFWRCVCSYYSGPCCNRFIYGFAWTSHARTNLSFVWLNTK